MKTIETSTLFSFINDDMGKNVDVFIDGSGETGKHLDASKDYFYGAGWSLADKDGHLQGYGVVGLEDAFTPHTIILELRSVAAFFDMLRTHYPHLCSSDYRYHVNLDNYSAAGALTGLEVVHESNHHSYLAVKAQVAAIEELTQGMNVTYDWVKGHDDNAFNRIADVMAKSAYRKLTSNGSFEGAIRRDILENLFVSHRLLTAVEFRANIGEEVFETNSFHLMGEAEKEAYLRVKHAEKALRQQMWATSETLYVTYQKEKFDGSPCHLVSYHYKGENYHSVMPEHEASEEKVNNAFRALVSALNSYKDFHAGETPKPVTLYTDLHIAGYSINALRNGKEADVPRRVEDVSAEVNELKSLMAVFPVRGVVDYGAEVRSLQRDAVKVMRSGILTAR